MKFFGDRPQTRPTYYSIAKALKYCHAVSAVYRKSAAAKAARASVDIERFKLMTLRTLVPKPARPR